MGLWGANIRLKWLCDTYIVGKGTIDVLAAAANENDKGQINVGLRNNDPFRSCISKISRSFQYSRSWHSHADVDSIISGSLWN